MRTSKAPAAEGEVQKYSKEELLRDPNVKRWHDNKIKRSVVAADVDLRRLGRFSDAIKLSPAQYARLPVEKMENLAMDYIDKLETAKNPKNGKKYSPTYIAANLKVIKSWAYWNRKRFERKINISNPNKRPTLEEERIPTPEELARVLYADSTPGRTRASIAIMAFSGARPEVQGDYLGLEGLRIKDFPDLKIEGRSVEFTKIPTPIRVREEISKSRHQYLTFLGEEGCRILKDYLEKRMNAEGEKLTPQSAVIGTTLSQAKQRGNFGMFEDASPFLRTTKVGNSIRKSMRTVGLPWRPYVFRSYFDTNLMLAESKGLISHAYQQFWMGHTGDIEAQYTTNKHRLPDNVMEDMQAKYAKVAQELLETSANKSKASSEAEERGLRRILRVAGKTDEEIAKLVEKYGSLTGVPDEEMDAILESRVHQSLGLNGNSSQKIVPQGEVRNYINQGWEYVPNPFLEKSDEAIVRLPSG